MTDKTQGIRAALPLLDPANDDQWTMDGLPRVEVVEQLSGIKTLLRGEITSAAPQFTRANPTLDIPEVKEDPEPEAPRLEDSLPDDGEYMPLTPAPVSREELALGQAKIEQAQAALAAAEAARNEADKLYKAALAEMDKAVVAAQGKGNPHQNTQDIRDYLNRQQQLREDRAAARRAILAAGLDKVMAGAGVSTLDQAMSRKNTRGTARPEVPLKTAE